MNPTLPWLIVVTGSPATGKTTIAESLCGSLNLPLVAKDAIKEEIYDTLEGATPEDSHRLGFVAVRLMHSWTRHLLQKDVSLILESNFKRSLSIDDLQELFALSRPIIVQCMAPEDHILDRYVERSVAGKRHPVHDDARRTDELRRDLDDAEYDLRGLDVPSVTVDTVNDDTDIESLTARILDVLGK